MSRISHKTLYVLLIISFLFVFSLTTVYGEENINIFIDDKPITFDVNPVIINGRTLVPFRAIFESINANVCWDNNTKTAIATKDGTLIELTIGRNLAMVNRTGIDLDTPALIINNRTMVPLRFISENLGFDVGWDSSSRSIYLTSKVIPLQEIVNAERFSFDSLEIGSSLEELKNTLGEPNRIDSSIFNMEWYIYNSNYNYIQFGIKNNKVVAFYTNSSNWKTAQGISSGSTTDEANIILGQPQAKILLGNTYIPFENINKYSYKDLSVWTFEDKFENDKLTAIFVIDYAVECNLSSPHPNTTSKFRFSTERQLFDQLNSARQRHGLNLLVWDDLAAKAAILHSQDMAKNNFFDHTNLDNLETADRLINQGITYSSTAENIANAYPTSFFVHSAWMNSEGHRKNMLGNYANMGVGVEISGPLKIYYTEDFYTGR